ncbi:MAG: mevalonate kinase [Desulfurococcaceae archaeon]
MKCSMAPGKIILFGEHFVVVGKPALGLAVTRYATVCVEKGKGLVYSSKLGRIEPGAPDATLFNALLKSFEEWFGVKALVDIYVDSEIPISSGMGSSAAIAVATAHALLGYYNVDHSKEDVLKLAHEAEKAVHYKPSGVDTTLSTYGGFLYYKQGVIRKLDVRLPIGYSIVVVNTGVKRSTGAVVREVLERYSRLGKTGEHIYSAAEELVELALKALHEGDVKLLGELMVVNHGLLWSMGASSRICDLAVYELLEQGALGAKLSGAGRGGIVIGLAKKSKAEILINKLSEKGLEVFTVEPDYTGVKNTIREKRFSQ